MKRTPEMMLRDRVKGMLKALRAEGHDAGFRAGPGCIAARQATRGGSAGFLVDYPASKRNGNAVVRAAKAQGLYVQWSGDVNKAIFID